jgi:hypothetical protein
MSDAHHSQGPSSEASALHTGLDPQPGEAGEMGPPAKKFGLGLRVVTSPDGDDEQQQGASLQRKTLSQSRSLTPEGVAGFGSGPDVQPIFRMLMSGRYDTMADAVKVRPCTPPPEPCSVSTVTQSLVKTYVSGMRLRFWLHSLREYPGLFLSHV